MAQASTARAEQRQMALSGMGVTRWTWVFVITGILVVLVVVGFLIGIVGNLRSIDAALAEADSAVTNTGDNVEPLPGQVGQVNSTLSGIDTALKPIPGQADQIIANLGRIRGNLTSVDGSLKTTSGSLVDTSSRLVNTSGGLVDTSRSLVDTSSSLVDTSNVLVTVRGLAGNITQVLEGAQNPPDRLGTMNIWQRVQTANGILNPVKADTGNINAQLVEVNKHADSICARLGPGQC